MFAFFVAEFVGAEFIVAEFIGAGTGTELDWIAVGCEAGSMTVGAPMFPTFGDPSGGRGAGAAALGPA
ncbi:MAG TPA: hypothetical protein VGN12_03085 [Pirellulales bacterium]